MNVVLTGENFPVGSLKLGDFEYRHRKLTETLRLPIALRGETHGGNVVMQVLPDRFEASIMRVDDSANQAAGLLELVEVFQDYVGRRSVSGVGLNVQLAMEAPGNRRADVYRTLVNATLVDEVLESDDEVVGDLNFYFKKGNEDRARVLVKMSEPGDVVFDYNFHFEVRLPDRDALTCARNLPDSTAHAIELSERFQDMIDRAKVKQ
jgi:hypothetical protein